MGATLSLADRNSTAKRNASHSKWEEKEILSTGTISKNLVGKGQNPREEEDSQRERRLQQLLGKSEM